MAHFLPKFVAPKVNLEYFQQSGSQSRSQGLQLFNIHQNQSNPISSTYCCVAGCKHPDNHVTDGHRCRKCNQFGHGIVECGNRYLCSILLMTSSYFKIPREKQCRSPGCRHMHTHTTEGHYCSKCRQYHSLSDCPKNKCSDKKDIIIQAIEKCQYIDGMIYTIVYVGTGSYYYIKRNNRFSEFELFFMHADKWGQYGPMIDDRAKLSAFLNGYMNIETGRIGL
jgi:hypothetical protein